MSFSHHELGSFLGRVRRRWTVTAVLRAAASAAAGGGAIVLAAVIVDRVWLPSDLPLVVLAVVAMGAALGYAAWMLWPLRRAPSPRQVARFVEEQVPELEDRLASAADLGDPAADAGIHRLIVADAARRVGGIDLDRVIARAQITRAVGLGSATGIALAVVLGVAADPARRAVGAAWLYAFPDSVRLEVSPGDERIMAGQPLRIRAEVFGVADASGRTQALLQVEADDGWQDVEMVPVGEGFQFEFASVGDSFRYRVAAASARSEIYDVVAMFLPGVARIDVEYDYPAFTGLERRVEVDGGDIYAPAGTAVTLTVHADKPVEAGAMVLGGGSRVPLAPRDDEVTLTARFEVTSDDAYRLELSDHDGLSNPGEVQYFIRAIDDRPPDVRILRPEGDRVVTPLEEVTIEARADDDYGLERFEIVYAVRGGEEQAVPFPGSTGLSTRAGTHTLYVEDLDVVPGDFVTYYARAIDVNRAKASTEARSDIYFLDVTPFEQEFVEAQSQSQNGDGGTGLADLTAAQRAIIVATWKLDRRPDDMSADDDVRTVARAQGELKLRTQQALEEFSGGSPGGGPPSGAAADGDPLALAVLAMGDAEAELDGVQTEAALPHEMTALNQLLRAQAEVRRREVARQQSATGGGQGRAGQDLSALFDQELRRLQQTNYETRASARQDTPESEALARVRELARRQDDLARRQRDLERRRAELDPEELERQLARLTLEQTELRREAEELARTLDQLGEASGQRPGGQTAEQTARAGSEQMRGVSEAMRGATSELRRQDLESAAAQGQQALESLRSLEQELRALDPDERRRALSELELEARQLADAQARIAGEAEQLGVGQAARNPRARLADEQLGMADRVDELQADTEMLARADDDVERRAALDEAAEALAVERIAERLRESAETLRGAPDAEDAEDAAEAGRDLAESERALADALSQTAERLGQVPGGETADARRLSEELESAQALRERLADLERQIEAEGQAAAPGEPSGDLASLEAAYEDELRGAEELLADLRRDDPSLGGRLAAAAGQYTRSAPGTEAFKQDFERWDELRRDVDDALERYAATRSRQLSIEELRGRLSSGADERVPESYRALVEAYYEALAAAGRRR